MERCTAVNSLVDYSSDEECYSPPSLTSKPDNNEILKCSKNDIESGLLPVPDAISQMFGSVSDSEIKSDPDKHGGRLRSFPHERGVWATYVYIEYQPSDEFLEMVEELKKTTESHGIILDIVEDFHISLSKTVKLRHHWIPSFVDSLKAKLSYFFRFKVVLQSLEVYENEEKTRTFLGLKAHTGFEKLVKIANKVDSCLQEFKLPTFYQNPSFHLSCASCVGSYAEKIEKIMADLNVIFQLFVNSHSKCNQIWVTKICCKSGNKQFTFSLKS